MKVLLARVAITLALAFSFLASAIPSAASDASPAFVVRIAQTTGGGVDIARPNVIIANTTIVNTSNRPQEITVWTRYGWSWVSDHPSVSPGIDALQNAPSHVLLAPAASYSKRLDLTVTRKRPPVFRLGFAADARMPLSGERAPTTSHKIYWSNLIELKR
jgi:hypothetical protein